MNLVNYRLVILFGFSASKCYVDFKKCKRNKNAMQKKYYYDLLSALNISFNFNLNRSANEFPGHKD